MISLDGATQRDIKSNSIRVSFYGPVGNISRHTRADPADDHTSSQSLRTESPMPQPAQSSVIAEHPERPATAILLNRSCRACDVVLSRLTRSCTTCGSSELDEVPASGSGRIVSWKIVPRPADFPPGRVTTAIIAIIELDEGPRIFGEIDGLPDRDRRVRAHFSGVHAAGQFPVFVLEPVRIARPGRRTRVIDGQPQAVDWVRSALRQCRLLAASNSVGTYAQSLVEYAIRWAPFGGAGATDLLVAFGVSRDRFLDLIHDALVAQVADDRTARLMKGQLLDTLVSAWQGEADEAGEQSERP
ncbi:Zn-ribbon domain-containing OB-fold protein [Nocardia stercoris]|uniref:Zn-ribbon domain-containing OB-fold protein n=1 Tax=Nocardia stercoris TaxID=2483361 RepID=UPI00131A4150|nr:OB-fold domain-containing protein [Nocardia stercoris]